MQLEFVVGVKVELTVNGNREDLSGLGMNSEGLKDLAEMLIPLILVSNGLAAAFTNAFGALVVLFGCWLEGMKVVLNVFIVLRALLSGFMVVS